MPIVTLLTLIAQLVPLLTADINAGVELITAIINAIKAARALGASKAQSVITTAEVCKTLSYNVSNNIKKEIRK